MNMDRTTNDQILGGCKRATPITIYEFDESKYGEARNAIISGRVAKYLNVPGFSYSLNPWLEAKDALHLVGLA